jgi:hypothetical protein
MSKRSTAAASLSVMAGALVALAGFWGCASWTRPDYALFAQRCSKCHSLARPLTSGIDDDAYWVDYVARMRRQPASGISAEDTVGILRFLHYFSIEEKRKSGKLPPEASAPVSPAVPPAGSAPPAPATVPAPAQSGASTHTGLASPVARTGAARL